MTAEQLLRIFGYTADTADQLKALNDQSVGWGAMEFRDTTEDWLKLAVKLNAMSPPFLALYAAAVCKLGEI